MGDLASALEQLEASVPQLLQAARLGYESLKVVGTPRRQAVLVHGLAAQAAGPHAGSAGTAGQGCL